MGKDGRRRRKPQPNNSTERSMENGTKGSKLLTKFLYRLRSLASPINFPTNQTTSTNATDEATVWPRRDCMVRLRSRGKKDECK